MSTHYVDDDEDDYQLWDEHDDESSYVREDDQDDLFEDWYDHNELPEPDCHACYDGGCRACEPTRFDLWRWQMMDRLRSLRHLFRRRGNTSSTDEPPF